MAAQVGDNVNVAPAGLFSVIFTANVVMCLPHSVSALPEFCVYLFLFPMILFRDAYDQEREMLQSAYTWPNNDELTLTIG